MAEYRKTFTCEVLTPEGARYDFTPVLVSFPTTDGQVGILADRAPLVTAIGAGVMIVQALGGQRTEYFIASGFARVNENRMVLLCDECQPVSEIDREEAWERIEKAQSLPADTPQHAAIRDRQLSAARERFRLVQRHRAKMEKRGAEERPSDPDLD